MRIGGVREARGRDTVRIITRVNDQGDSHLLEIVQAGYAGGLVFRIRQSWKQQSGKNGNDRDDHQQFDEGEPAGVTRRRVPRVDMAATFGFACLSRDTHSMPDIFGRFISMSTRSGFCWGNCASASSVVPKVLRQRTPASFSISFRRLSATPRHLHNRYSARHRAGHAASVPNGRAFRHHL